MIALACVCILLGVFTFIGYSWSQSEKRLSRLSDLCKQAYANIEAELQNRADLVLELAQCAKNFTDLDAKILMEIEEARRAAVRASIAMRFDAEAVFERKRQNLLEAADQHPELAGSILFRQLRKELFEVEQRLAASRQSFDLAVGQYIMAQKPRAVSERTESDQPLHLSIFNAYSDRKSMQLFQNTQ